MEDRFIFRGCCGLCEEVMYCIISGFTSTCSLLGELAWTTSRLAELYIAVQEPTRINSHRNNPISAELWSFMWNIFSSLSSSEKKLSFALDMFFFFFQLLITQQLIRWNQKSEKLGQLHSITQWWRWLWREKKSLFALFLHYHHQAHLLLAADWASTCRSTPHSHDSAAFCFSLSRFLLPLFSSSDTLDVLSFRWCCSLLVHHSRWMRE